MFQLVKEEIGVSRCQFGALKRGQNIKYLPYAFTENGVAMLSSVLNSERAIQVNIHIMRAFTHLRELLSTYHLAQRLDAMERGFRRHDKQISRIFDAIRELIEHPGKPTLKVIGFQP